MIELRAFNFYWLNIAALFHVKQSGLNIRPTKVHAATIARILSTVQAYSPFIRDLSTRHAV